MAKEKWTEDDMPDQSGRVCVVTGANSGLGLETARALAAHGASVVLAVRNLDKGAEAVARIRAATPNADLSVQRLDLASLDSIRTAARELRDNTDRIDLLINNAGVMYTPRQKTTDGFELQFGTNHIGHFALTGLLLDRLLPVEGSRIVTVSSIAHRILSRIDFDDLQAQRRYNRIAAYGRSKLANLLFTYELQRRLTRGRSPDRGARRPSRRLPHRARTPHSRRAPAEAAGAEDDPARRDWRAGNPSRRHRPERRGRPVLRAGRRNGDPGSPGGRHLESPITQPRHPAATVGRVTAVDRRLLPAPRGPEPTPVMSVCCRPSCRVHAYPNAQNNSRGMRPDDPRTS